MLISKGRMHPIALLLSGLAFAGLGRRVQRMEGSPSEEEQRHQKVEESSATPALAKLLLAMIPSVGWQVYGSHLTDAVQHHIRLESAPRMQLLGPDGLPHGEEFGSMDENAPGLLSIEEGEGKKPKAFGGPAAGGLVRANDLGNVPNELDGVGEFLIPGELEDFDWTVQGIEADRPDWDIGKASGRFGEVVWGAGAVTSAAEIPEWSSAVQARNCTQVLGIFNEQEVAERSPDGTPLGYMKAMVDAGFPPDGVALVDPCSPNSRETILNVMRAAQEKKNRVCVHCADGNFLTGLVMADWLLTDYINTTNYEEACAALFGTKTRTGIGRTVNHTLLEKWVTEGRLSEYDPTAERLQPVFNNKVSKLDMSKKALENLRGEITGGKKKLIL